MSKKLLTRLLLLATLASTVAMFRCVHCHGTGFHASTDNVCIFCAGKGHWNGKTAGTK